MITITELRKLDRQPVLVRSKADRHNPPTGRWGWFTVRESGEGQEPIVEVVVEFPDMFNEPAHERIFCVGPAELEHLVTVERNGAFELTLSEPLDEMPPGSPARSPLIKSQHH